MGDREFCVQIYDTMGVTELPNFPDDYLIMDGWIIVYSVAEERRCASASHIGRKRCSPRWASPTKPQQL